MPSRGQQRQRRTDACGGTELSPTHALRNAHTRRTLGARASTSWLTQASLDAVRCTAHSHLCLLHARRSVHRPYSPVSVSRFMLDTGESAPSSVQDAVLCGGGSARRQRRTCCMRSTPRCRLHAPSMSRGTASRTRSCTDCTSCACSPGSSRSGAGTSGTASCWQ